MPSQDLIGLVAESVIVDHTRRLQFNVAGNAQLPIGYIAKPEVNAAANVGTHWLLVEAKYRANPQASFGDVGGAADIRLVATRDAFQPNAASSAHYLPAHELAMVF